ncbi:MIP/aquaporin family protein [Cellulosimicrobium cellulans]|uniref:MIP/aquaporin family protein n=1 Tax=Cellulosimicrobium cellulans TaxID=1710 RepID=UPI0008496CE6|nr:aquaporin [Cellulosimicrobium cellulans]
MSQDTTAAGAPGGSVAEDVTVARTEPVAVVQPGLLARLGAEVFGTFALVLAIVGVALYLRFTNAGIVLPVAFAGGVALAGVIAAVGHVSGGHFNPAVTLGAAIGGRTAWRDVLPYWLAQFVGGALAALVLLATTPQGQAQLEWLAQNQLISEATRSAVFSSTANGFGEHSPIAGLTAGNLEFSFASALLLEVVATAVFVGVVLGVTDKRASTRGIAPFAIGLTFTALLLVASPVTNGSLNPARSLASAILAQPWALEQFWQLFLWGPLLGAAIAGLFYRAFAFAPTHDDLLGEDQVVVGDDVPAGEATPVEEPAAPAAERSATPAAEQRTAATDDEDGPQAPRV